MIVGENRKGPQSWRKGREGDREHSSERESSTKEDEEPSPRRRDNSGIIYVFCFVLFLIKHTFVARHPWLPCPPSLNPEPYYTIISAFASWIESKMALVEMWTSVMLRGLSKLHWDPESVTQSSWPSSLYMLCWALWESGIWVWSTTRFMLPSGWICFIPQQFLFLSLSSISRVIALSYCPHVIGPSQCFVVIILTLMSYTDSQSKTIYIYM